jgi:hypothetical protein
MLELGMIRSNAFMDRHANGRMMESIIGCFEVLCTVVGIELTALVVNDDWK